MIHEEAKQLLSRAQTFSQRVHAVDAAMQLGMTLAEIETYLDWLDAAAPLPPPDGDEEENRQA